MRRDSRLALPPRVPAVRALELEMHESGTTLHQAARADAIAVTARAALVHARDRLGHDAGVSIADGHAVCQASNRPAVLKTASTSMDVVEQGLDDAIALAR